MENKRELNIKDIRVYSPKKVGFKGRFFDSIGNPELKGTWIIWGGSFTGKTRFALQLAKYLSNFTTVGYNSLEEGLSLSLQDAIIDIGIESRNFTLFDKEPIDDLRLRLQRKRAPKVIIIDSLQYTGLSYRTYTQLRDDHPNTLFIFISHSDGLEPKGGVAKSIKYDAFVKIHVNKYVANIQSRFGGGTPYVIWKEKAEQLNEK